MNRILVIIPVEEKHKRYLEDIGKSCLFEYTCFGDGKAGAGS